jgi:hypothetical protein
MKHSLCLALAILFASSTAFAQEAKDDKQNSKKALPPFRWVNPLPKTGLPDGVKHGTFKSPSMNVDVGY